MQFYFGYSYDGKPYTSDSNRTWNTIGMPVWFTRGTSHRAQFVLYGPYEDPNGIFVVRPGEALVKWEVKQPPANSWQAINRPYPEIYSILGVDKSFVTPQSLLYKTVDPDFLFKGGEWCYIWFGMVSPAVVIGGMRDPNLNPLRPNVDRGSLLAAAPPDPELPEGYILGPPVGPPIVPDSVGLPPLMPPPDWQSPPY
jgi:hypothetical protein